MGRAPLSLDTHISGPVPPTHPTGQQLHQHHQLFCPTSSMTPPKTVSLLAWNPGQKQDCYSPVPTPTIGWFWTEHLGSTRLAWSWADPLVHLGNSLGTRDTQVRGAPLPQASFARGHPSTPYPTASPTEVPPAPSKCAQDMELPSSFGELALPLSTGSGGPSRVPAVVAGLRCSLSGQGVWTGPHWV